MKKLGRSIDEQIRKAIEDGQFDNLAGKGQPIDLSVNPHEDPTWRLAFQALRSSGYTLPWIERRRQIEADVDQALENLEQTWRWRTNALSDGEHPTAFVKSEWQRALTEFRQKVVEINQRIFSYNLEVPSHQFQHRKIDLELEVKRITSAVD
jgi:DnaJ homolog subfamily C member 28